MPYKHPKIVYGLPNDPYDYELNNEYIEDIIAALGISRKPVGVKLLFSKEQYEAIEVPEFSGKVSYCCMVEKATRGMCIKSRLEHHMCDGGTIALGLEGSTEEIESGMTYFSYDLYSTPAAARRTREAIPGLYRTGASTYGTLVMPLSDFEATPDVVIMIVNPYQAMRIQQGYVYKNGGRIDFSTAAMQAICAEATIDPYLSGKMSMTVFCPSTRLLAKWKDEEMAVGIPFEHFQHTVEGVMATINSTDLVNRKKEIVERFNLKGKELKLDYTSYE